MIKKLKKVLDKVSRIEEDGSLVLHNKIRKLLDDCFILPIEIPQLVKVIAANSPTGRVGGVGDTFEPVLGLFFQGVYLYAIKNALHIKVLSDPKTNLISTNGRSFPYPEDNNTYFLERIPKELEEKVDLVLYELCLHIINYGYKLVEVSRLTKEELVLRNWGVLKKC